MRTHACLLNMLGKQNAAKDLKDKLTVHKFKGDTSTPNELEEWIMKLEDNFLLLSQIR